MRGWRTEQDTKEQRQKELEMRKERGGGSKGELILCA